MREVSTQKPKNYKGTKRQKSSVLIDSSHFSLETALHLSHQFLPEKWQIQPAEDIEIIMKRKKIIQEQNRFFTNFEISASITSERFAVVIEIISSGHEINIEKSKTYCLDKEILYVKLNPWHPIFP